MPGVLTGQEGSQFPQLPAQSFRLFHQVHGIALPRQSQRGSHAARPATDYQDMGINTLLDSHSRPAQHSFFHSAAHSHSHHLAGFGLTQFG